MRLNAYLARTGVASRRGADELIKTGRVRVNGVRGELNTFVQATDAARQLLDDFSELGRSRLRELLDRIDRDTDLRTIERAITLLTDAAGDLDKESTT